MRPPDHTIFTQQEIIALSFLQRYLHHSVIKKLGKRCRATATTMERLRILKECPDFDLTPELEEFLMECSKIITAWICKHQGAIFNSVIHPVVRKNQTMQDSIYYARDELFNITLLESLRILYNYDPRRGAKPLTYLINTLRQRKNTLINLEVPTSDDIAYF